MRKNLFISGTVIILLVASLLVMNREEKTDVVVIGGGAAGMTAAIEAYDNGSDVILLEKMPFVGGNTGRAASGMNGTGTSLQKKLGIKWSRDLYYQDTMKSGHYLNNEKLVAILVDNSRNAVEWLKQLGADLSDLGILGGHSVPRTHRPSGGAAVGGHIVGILEKQVRKRNIDLRLENRAVAVIYDGRAKGVEVINQTGREYKILAKSVVFASGGFGGSPELFVRYNPQLTGFNSTNHPGATGDAIKLGEEVGADFIGMNYIQTHPTVVPDYGVMITEAVRGNGAILVNQKGRRFTDELSYRDVLSSDILEQDGKYAYLIFDEKVRNSLSAADDYISMKLIKSGSTYDELAALLNMDSIIFSSTISKYNSCVLSGKDSEYNRKNLASAIDTPPYYGVRVAPAVHYCMGGIKIDSRTRVIDREGNVLKGLFAAGEVTGGVHGANRLGGNSLTETIVFGRMAGREAADSAK